MELNVYLNFQGNCEEALRFYADCFDGEILSLIRFGDSPMPDSEAHKDKVMHAQLQLGDVLIMASDNIHEPACTPGTMVHLSLNFPEKISRGKHLDDIFDALSQGGTVTMPLQNTFWNAYFGMLIDKYGINWMFNHDLPA